MRKLAVRCLPAAAAAALALGVAGASPAAAQEAYVSAPGATVVVPGEAGAPATVAVADFLALEPQALSSPALVPCPGGATCLTLPGTFFTATNKEPMRIYKLLVPRGRQFRRMETTFRFRLGAWNADPRGIFTLVYLNRNGKFRSNTLAVVDIARQQRRVHLETTLGLPNVGPPAGVQNEREKVSLVAGQTYDVKYVYDAENLRFHLTMVDATGKTVVDLEEALWSTTDRIASRGSFWIQFSEPLTDSLHVPSIGWSHSDLTFALIP